MTYLIKARLTLWWYSTNNNFSNFSYMDSGKYYLQILCLTLFKFRNDDKRVEGGSRNPKPGSSLKLLVNRNA